MTRFADEKLLLPEYPRTKHLPFQANATHDDLIATEAECRIVFESANVFVEEKIDGASVGMMYGPVIRNRGHILVKGYTARTAAKKQFSSVWNWYYEHVHFFEQVERLVGPASVYGEWVVMQHGMVYDLLPSWFIAYDIFSHDLRDYLDPAKSRGALEAAGFVTTPLLDRAPTSFKQLAALASAPSTLTTLAPREGVYVKVSDGTQITHRFKMVRPGFRPGALLEDGKFKKNFLK